MEKMMSFICRYKFTLVVAAVTGWLTLAPVSEDMSLLSPPWESFDKTVHMGLFGLLTMAWLTEFWRGRTASTGRIVLSAILIALISTAAGGAVELAQTAMGLGRYGDWLDLAADALGAFATAAVWLAGRLSANRQN